MFVKKLSKSLSTRKDDIIKKNHFKSKFKDGLKANVLIISKI